MKVLLINSGKKFEVSGGKLSQTLHDVAKQTLQELGINILETIVDNGYNEEDEVQKILQSDVLIYQMPGWWMGEPWILKEYIDKVFTVGNDRFFASDGRHRDNPTKNYGKGGLLHDKKYMFSLTWNAPLEAFTDRNEFFGGLGVDMVYMHLHKAHEFIGMSSLPTFICCDVMKNPQVESYIKDYKLHLQKIFSKRPL